MHRTVFCLLCACAVFGLAGSGAASAKARRAVIVGIDKYAVNPATDRVRNLAGSVNDAQAIKALLEARFDFRAQDIHLLLDGQATREQILGEIRTHLIAPAQPDDVSLFFYAGHGSWVKNSSSQEADKKDETLVPSDSNRGAADIRDKELAPLFNQVIDRHADLVVLVDSCHSGSIARGFPAAATARSAPPQLTAMVAPLPRVASPESRGALIFSAAQDFQIANEKTIGGQVRGLFTSALQQVLAQTPTGESADATLERVRALMLASGLAQDPVLAGTPERRRRTLFGERADASNRQTRAAVSRIRGDRVELQGGLAIGLSRLATLTSGKSGVRLQVDEAPSLNVSQAKVLAGDISAVRPGDLYEVENPGIPVPYSLSVYAPEAGAGTAELRQWGAALDALRTMGDVAWVRDPTEETPTHVLMRAQGRWRLTRGDGRAVGTFESLPQPSALRALLKSEPASRLFVALPPPQELIEQLRQSRLLKSGPVVTAASPADADYILVGRWERGAPALCWLRPNVVQGAGTGPMPVRTAWLPATELTAAAQLESSALRLNKIKAWHLLPSPANAGAFPYRLAFEDKRTGRLQAAGAPLRDGEDYQLLLTTADGQSPAGSQARYVYVFVLDSNGQAQLLFPDASTGSVENRFPERGSDGRLPARIPIGSGIHITPPLGVDTYILVSSQLPIPSPGVVFSFDGVRGQLPQLADPLAALLLGIGEGLRAAVALPPIDWSIERRVLQSVSADGR